MRFVIPSVCFFATLLLDFSCRYNVCVHIILCRLVQTMDYSVIVFDTAPTGHTLRLLQFPSTLEKGLAKVMSLKNKFGGLMSQVLIELQGITIMNY